ncbi:MAG: DEAD/DEAH box helicase [Actinomycetes bacterium]
MPRPTPAHRSDRPRPTRGPRPARGRRPYGSRTSGPRPGPRRPSPLEQALDAAAAAPAPETTTFAGLGLPQRLAETLAGSGVTEPFPIQARTIPDALAGRDVLGRAQTGSGKTLAFGLPLLARLVEDGSDRTAGTPRALVLVPTRELARQVTDALAPLGIALGLRVVSVYGGAPIVKQIKVLRRPVDVVVATPGRLLDLVGREVIDLGRVRVNVLDEADFMADLGFLPDVTRILDLTPGDTQRLMFSATLDRGVDRLARTYLSDPAFHAVAGSASPVETMDHQVLTVRGDDKVTVAAEIAGRPGRTLVFVRTKHGADRLAGDLTRAGSPATAIHGNLHQKARQRALAAFSDGSPRVLVATDVAARGIHVDDVDLVVHYDPPNTSKDYLHRSGRTARAGADGTVVSLVLPHEVGVVARIHRDAGVSATATRVQPGHDAVRDLATSGEPVVVRTRPPRRRDEATRRAHQPRGRRGHNGQGGPSRQGGQASRRERAQDGRRGRPDGDRRGTPQRAA